MKNLVNRVQLVGHVGKTPEILHMNQEKALAKFSIAVNSYYKNKTGERIEKTEWFNLVAWNRTALLIERLVVKGSKVAVSGLLENRHWTDKNGEKRSAIQININEINLLSNRAQSAA